MLCDSCGKKDATSIFMSKDNKLKYLCGTCYRKLNNEIELEMLAIKETNNIELETKCLSCGETFEEFKSSGMFGCENCYNAFADYLNKIFITKFKEQKYLGKKPNIFYIKKQIKELEQMVEICLKNGNLQKATKYGVEIEKLKEQCYGRL